MKEKNIFIGQLYAFIVKEFYHIFRDGRTLLILFVMPLAQVILFGLALTNEIKNAEIAVIDEVNTPLSLSLVNKLSASGYFNIKKYLNNETDIEREFKQGSIKMVFIIPCDFDRNIYKEKKASIQLVTDASDLNTANTLSNYAISIINDFTSNLNKNEIKTSSIYIKTRMLYNPNLRSVYVFIPGVMALVLMLISSLLTAITIAKEKELGTFGILIITPLKPFTIIIGKVFPYLLLSMINSVIILFMGIFVFALPLRGNVFALLLQCFLFAITSLSLGILISTKSNTQQEAMYTSLITLMMPTMLLTGFIFPIESMALPLQYISNIIPATWFISIVKTIMIKGLGIGYYWIQTLVLMGMTFLFVLLSIINMKTRGK
ncbi:MAG: ABC transporter permease [bacterium]